MSKVMFGLMMKLAVSFFLLVPVVVEACVMCGIGRCYIRKSGFETYVVESDGAPLCTGSCYGSDPFCNQLVTPECIGGGGYLGATPSFKARFTPNSVSVNTSESRLVRASSVGNG